MPHLCLIRRLCFPWPILIFYGLLSAIFAFSIPSVWAQVPKLERPETLLSKQTGTSFKSFKKLFIVFNLPTVLKCTVHVLYIIRSISKRHKSSFVWLRKHATRQNEMPHWKIHWNRWAARYLVRLAEHPIRRVRIHCYIRRELHISVIGDSWSKAHTSKFWAGDRTFWCSWIWIDGIVF